MESKEHQNPYELAFRKLRFQLFLFEIPKTQPVSFESFISSSLNSEESKGIVQAVSSSRKDMYESIREINPDAPTNIDLIQKALTNIDVYIPILNRFVNSISMNSPVHMDKPWKFEWNVKLASQSSSSEIFKADK